MLNILWTGLGFLLVFIESLKDWFGLVLAIARISLADVIYIWLEFVKVYAYNFSFNYSARSVNDCLN